MDKVEGNVSGAVQRRLAQLKILTRVLEHELDLAKEGKDVTLDRGLSENLLDSIELFIEDCEDIVGGSGAKKERAARSGDAKPAVTRLN